MQILFHGTGDSEPLQLDLDAVPRVGDEVVVAPGRTQVVQRVQWDLAEQPRIEPLGARVVRVYCG